jgi:hypothetical protein
MKSNSMQLDMQPVADERSRLSNANPSLIVPGESAIASADVGAWLQGLLDEAPQRRRNSVAAEHWRDATRHWTHVWQETCGRGRPRPGAIIDEFRRSLASDRDLAPPQIDQFCQRITSLQSDEEWLATTTERFLALTRPWHHLWLSFGQWALRWSETNRIRTIAFMARDAIPLYIVAAASKASSGPKPQIELTHHTRISKQHMGQLAQLLTEPSLALVDSGCYGTCMSQLVESRSTLVSDEARTACLFFFSRNPHIFGYMNYIMAPTMLRSPADSGPATDFVIYAGDLLEAMPKPYRYRISHGGIAPTDLLSFVLSMTLMQELRETAAVHEPAGSELATCAASLLYLQYRERARVERQLIPAPFDHPAPKSPPRPSLIRTEHLRSTSPQDRLFGYAAG